ncbi:MAG: glycosyltransferase family 39 protein [Candidatus Woesearchaeota archaeon]
MKATTKMLIIIIALALIARLPSINNPLFGDEIQWQNFYCTGQYWFSDIGHPSLSGWLTNLNCILFGVYPWAIRLPFLLVSLAAILLTYFYGRRFLSEKTAIVASLLLALSPWLAGIGMATNQDNYLMLFFTAGLFAYRLWLGNPKAKYLAVIAVMFGLSLITKSAAVLLLGIIGAHQLWLAIRRQQNWKKSFKLWPMLLGITIPAAYYAIQFLTGATYYTGYTLHRISIKLFTAGGFSFPLASWVLAIVLASPAFFALLALVLARRADNESPLLWAWILVPAFVYSFLIINNNIERFMQIALPAMALLVSNGITSIEGSLLKAIRGKAIAYFGISSIVLLLLAYLLPSPDQYASPYYSLAAQLSTFIHPGRFFFPIISDMGPSYYLPLSFVIMSFVVAAAWLGIALYGIFKQKKDLLKLSIILLFITAVATNAIALAEQNFTLKGPDIPAMAKAADNALSATIGNNMSVLLIGAHPNNYIWRNEPRGGILSSSQANLSRMHAEISALEMSGREFQEQDTGIIIKRVGIVVVRSEEEFREYAQMALSSNLVLFEDYPPLPENNPLKQVLGTCRKLGSVRDKGLVFSMHSCKTP